MRLGSYAIFDSLFNIAEVTTNSVERKIECVRIS